MLSRLDIHKVLFLDIETVPAARSLDELDERGRALWEVKARSIAREGESPDEIYGRAGIYAEFGRIVCISVGYIIENANGRGIRITSFCHNDEKELLEAFAQLVNQRFSTEDHHLCAHNGKEFDFPYIARRMLVNGVRLPSMLDIAGRKPWEIRHLDTLELWKFGDRKNFTSLDLLVHIFDIPSPKSDISGADVCRVYWEEGDLPRIMQYCQQDVLALAQVLLRYRGEALIAPENVTIVKAPAAAAATA